MQVRPRASRLRFAGPDHSPCMPSKSPTHEHDSILRYLKRALRRILVPTLGQKARRPPRRVVDTPFPGFLAPCRWQALLNHRIVGETE